MTHPPPRPRRPGYWQTPVTLLVLVGILAGGAWWGWNSLTESTAEPVCEVRQLPNGKLTVQQVQVNVYNGGAASGKAREVADLLKKRGFQIGRVANEPANQKVNGAVVRAAAVKAPEAGLLGLQFVKRVPVVADQRTEPSVDLIVGKGFTITFLKTRAAASVPVPGGQHCVMINPREKPIPSGQNPN